jgi:hypothetical protein
MLKISEHHWIHVMNDNIRMNLVTLNSQITTIVSYNDVFPKLTPLCRRVELLIDPTIEPERCRTDLASER